MNSSLHVHCFWIDEQTTGNVYPFLNAINKSRMMHSKTRLFYLLSRHCTWGGQKFIDIPPE
jgi:hypothetical protein